MGLTVGLLAASAVPELVGGAAMVALFTVAVRRPPKVTMAMFVLGLVAAWVYLLPRPQGIEPAFVELALGFAIQSGCRLGNGRPPPA